MLVSCQSSQHTLIWPPSALAADNSSQSAEGRAGLWGWGGGGAGERGAPNTCSLTGCFTGGQVHQHSHKHNTGCTSACRCTPNLLPLLLGLFLWRLLGGGGGGTPPSLPLPPSLLPPAPSSFGAAFRPAAPWQNRDDRCKNWLQCQWQLTELVQW